MPTPTCPAAAIPSAGRTSTSCSRAGIDVWTTLNIQHLESLNDVVQKITKVRVRETVPDTVFDRADEIVLVDFPPDELLKRLAEGKVYVQDTAARAVENFFKPQNLTALRELALRRAAERIDADLDRAHAGAGDRGALGRPASASSPASGPIRFRPPSCAPPSGWPT